METASSARAAILSRIKTALGGDDQTSRSDAVAKRLDEAPRGVVPARGQLPDDERVALFIHQAEGVSATVETVSSHNEIPGRVGAYLRERNLPASVRMGDDSRLRGADWAAEATLSLLDGPSDGTDLAGISHALGAVAETGTLVLASGPDNPTTVNFLPEYHIVVVDAADVAGDMESIWGKLRQRYGKGRMSRAVNFVTGPSRSADIEQKILLGAHGPRALHIVVVDKSLV